MTHAYEVFKDVVASVVGSAACVYTGQPFDTIKVRLQVQVGKFRNALHCFNTITKAEGVLALWKGAVPAFVGSLGENAVGFGVNGALRRIFVKYDSIPGFTTLRPYLTGGVTGFFSAFVLCPADVVKCRTQMNRLHGGSGLMSDVVRSTFRRQGMLGFYTGFTAQLLRDVPFYMSFFGSYETGCKLLRIAFPELPDTAIYFISGGFAGQIAWVVSMPADVVKSVVQTSTERVTPRQVANNILRTQGIRGFLSGIEVAIIRAFPANAALFVGYELSRKLFPESGAAFLLE